MSNQCGTVWYLYLSPLRAVPASNNVIMDSCCSCSCASIDETALLERRGCHMEGPALFVKTGRGGETLVISKSVSIMLDHTGQLTCCLPGARDPDIEANL